MNVIETPLNERAAELRSAFDRLFSQAPNGDIAVVEALLAIRVGSNPYLVRLTEVSGLFPDKKVTWLPSHVPELLGLAGLRGTVLPVYDLGMLLGCPKSAAPRWMLVTAGRPVGLAFDGFEGYLSVRPGAIVPEVRAEARERHVREIVHTADLVRPLVSLASLLESIQNRASHDDSEKE
jgi:purine-binding chemotaxis protein CheW